MKKPTASFFLLIAIICLSALGFLFARGTLKEWMDRKDKIVEGNILGEAVQDSISSPVNDFIQNTIDSTKESLTEKATEIEKNIIKNIENEVSNLTKSQVDTLKYQICRDLGVISVTPTPNP